MVEENIMRLHDKDHLVRDKIAVYSENHTKPINTLWANCEDNEC
jgi:hypothetical protein